MFNKKLKAQNASLASEVTRLRDELKKETAKLITEEGKTLKLTQDLCLTRRTAESVSDQLQEATGALEEARKNLVLMKEHLVSLEEENERLRALITEQVSKPKNPNPRKPKAKTDTKKGQTC